MRIIKLDLRSAELVWLEEDAIWVGVKREEFNVMSESDEEEAILWDVTEKAVDAGIKVWDVVTGGKEVHRVDGRLYHRSVTILNFEAIGENQILKMRELLKELVAKKERVPETPSDGISDGNSI